MGITIHLTQSSIIITLRVQTTRAAAEHLLIDCATCNADSGSRISRIQRSRVLDVSHITTAKHLAKNHGTVCVIHKRCAGDAHAGSLVNGSYFSEVGVVAIIVLIRLYTSTATIDVILYDTTSNVYGSSAAHLSVGLCASRRGWHNADTATEDVVTHRLVGDADRSIARHLTSHTTTNDVHEGVVRNAEVISESRCNITREHTRLTAVVSLLNLCGQSIKFRLICAVRSIE